MAIIFEETAYIDARRRLVEDGEGKEDREKGEGGEGNGSPILRRVQWQKPIKTAKDLLVAVHSLAMQSPDGKAMVAFGGEEKPFDLMSVEFQNDRLEFQFAEAPEWRPMMAAHFVGGAVQELKDKCDDMDDEKLDAVGYSLNFAGSPAEVDKIVMDVVRFPDDPTVYYFINIGTKA